MRNICFYKKWPGAWIKVPARTRGQIKAHFQVAEEVLALRKENGLRLGGGRLKKKGLEGLQNWRPPAALRRVGPQALQGEAVGPCTLQEDLEQARAAGAPDSSQGRGSGVS